jgi:rsbT co-antagonist protein RsbR
MSADATLAELAELRAMVATLEQLLAVHEQVSQEQSVRLEGAIRELEEGAKERNEMVKRLSVAVKELSTPILELWEDVLALPVIGVVDSQRTADMTERLLAAVDSKQCRYVIIDITGVEVVDTAPADHFVRLVRSVELLGARCMITGLRPAVAQTLVAIGVDLGQLPTLRNLKHGLRECFRLGSLRKAGVARA